MDERSYRIERLLDPLVLAAAILTIPLLVMEDSGEPWDTVAVVLNWATWLVFFGEAAVMLSVVPDRRRWLREHPLDVAITVLTPPFFPRLASVRLLRLFRLLRLVRLAPLARRLFSMEGLRYAALLAVLTVVAGGAGFAALESGQSTGDGIYWALNTMTTVGNGPVPKATGAKVLAVIVMVVGIGFVAILTGAVAQRFLAPEIEEEAAVVEEELDAASAAILRELQDMHRRLGDLELAVRRRRRP